MVGERTHDAQIGNPRSCAQDRCEKTSAAVLHEQALCLTHFLAHSYQYLESFDRRAARPESTHPPSSSELRAFIEECSVQALRLSLQSESLTNLERSRLLDILLWASELSDRLHSEQTSFAKRSNRFDENAPRESTSNP